MRTLSTTLSIALAALAAAASSAAAGSGRIVVMPFDGPTQLADDTRTTVVTEISRNHDVVAPTTWVKARRTAEKHELNEKAWAQAAKRAKVDAVIEGKVVTRGGKATLSLTVVDAHEGTEIDRVEITLPGKGVGRDAQERVRTELAHMLDWVDGVAVTRAVGGDDLSEMEELQDLDRRADDDEGDSGKRRGKRDKRDKRDRDDDDDRRGKNDRDDDDRAADDDDDDRDSDRRAKDDDGDREDGDDDDRRAKNDDDRDDDDRDNGDDDDDRGDKDDDDDDTRRGDDLVALFGDESPNPADGARAARRAAKAAAGARMFSADAGGFALSRSFTFQGGADAPADYPGGITKGLALTASLYPMSSDPTGRFSGIGVSLDYARGLASTVLVGDTEVFADFPIIYQEWAAAAHYRYNTPKVGIDASLGYRSITHVLDTDTEAADEMGVELDALDGEYGAITAGARFELAAGPKATVGLSAEYLYVTSVGVITAADILGSGQAWGARAQVDLRYNLSKKAYLHGALTYQQVGIEFVGDGEMDADWEVDSVTDAFTAGQLGVGIKY